jgi:catechol 2,3-dioxygenase-like lactoylglutathione lyase family enzyme
LGNASLSDSSLNTLQLKISNEHIAPKLPLTNLPGLIDPHMTDTPLFIFYVADQERSTRFYSQVLGIEPRLHVPGMTEFDLPGGGVLGLMPEQGVRKLLGEALPDPSAARGSPRAELYLLVDEPSVYHARALAAGAVELSPLLPRDWGHLAAYSLDPEAFVLAFASREVQSENAA